MRKMSQPEQKKMLRALDKAADYTKEGMQPDDALTKVAEEYQLAAPMVERVCEAYNKANAVAYMKSAPENKRAEVYPIVKIANVMNNIYGIKEKKAEEISFKKKNYTPAIRIEKPMDKSASRETDKKLHNPVSLPGLAVLLEQCRGTLQKMGAEADDARTKAEFRVRRDLDEVTEQVRKLVGRSQLKKTAQLIVDGFGEKEGHIVINAINANIDDPSRYLPSLEKKAQAVILPDTPLFNKVAELIEHRDMMKEAQNAADERREVIGQAIGQLIHNPLANRLFDVPTGGDTDSPHIDATTGMTGEWDAYEKDLKSRRMLYDLMLNDDEIKSYSPLKVRDTYNDIVETFPELTKQRKIVRAILRKSLAQGGNMDIYEIKDLISAGKEKQQGAKEGAFARKGLTDAINSTNSKMEGSGNDKSADFITQVANITV